MANSKIFRKAQTRSSGLGKSQDGYFGFSDAIKALKKSQVKKCEPYKFLLDVTKKIKQKTKNVYFKIIFSSTTGQVKLLVAIGKNKNAAANSDNTFFVFGNILSEKIISLVKIHYVSLR